MTKALQAKNSHRCYKNHLENLYELEIKNARGLVSVDTCMHVYSYLMSLYNVCRPTYGCGCIHVYLSNTDARTHTTSMFEIIEVLEVRIYNYVKVFLLKLQLGGEISQV